MQATSILLLALSLAAVACDPVDPVAEPADALRTPAPAPVEPCIGAASTCPMPCQPSGKGFCADVVGLCVETGFPAQTCETLDAWCSGGDSPCAMCGWLEGQARSLWGGKIDVAALQLECVCLGVANSAAF